MWKYQYDDEYCAAIESGMFLEFLECEEEEAFARHLAYDREQ